MKLVASRWIYLIPNLGSIGQPKPLRRLISDVESSLILWESRICKKLIRVCERPESPTKITNGDNVIDLDPIVKDWFTSSIDVLFDSSKTVPRNSGTIALVKNTLAYPSLKDMRTWITPCNCCHLTS